MPKPPAPARRLLALRLEAGLNQPEVAALLHVSVGTIGHWERGSSRVAGAALELLEIKLGVHPGYGARLAADEAPAAPVPAPVPLSALEVRQARARAALLELAL